MPLPASGQLSLSQIATEFGRTPPLNLSSLYGIASGLPASGQMNLSDFYGKASGALLSNHTMTIGSVRTNSDGKLVTHPNTSYGFSATNAIGAISPAQYRAFPITDVAYVAYDNGTKHLVVTIGYGFTYQAANTIMPVNLAKRIVFSSGQSFTLPQTLSGLEPTLFYTWAVGPTGAHNKNTFYSGSGYMVNLQYIIPVSAAPFPLSGSVTVTLEY
jgi:hypothetical protein